MTVGSDPEALVRDVQRDPGAARAAAERVLDGSPSRHQAAVATWALGLAHRELGDLAQARRALERGWLLAVELDDRDLAGEIAISLSLVVAYQGELPNALEILAVSEPGLAGRTLGRLRTQRGLVLYEHGRFVESVPEYEFGIRLLIEHGDSLGVLRSRINLGAVLSYLGRVDDARAHLRAADHLAAEQGQPILHAVVAQNLAHLATLDGEFPAAFDDFERASGLFQSCGYDGPMARSMRIDHARALLQANLLDEAMSMADAVVRESTDAESRLDLAAALVLVAEVRMAAADTAGGLESGEAAVDAFRSLGRRAWAAMADAVVLRARSIIAVDPTLAVDLANNALDLGANGCGLDALRVRLLEAEVRLRLGDVDGAGEVLRAQARAVRLAVTQQPEALRIRALVDLAAGDRRHARRAVNLGVRLLAEHQATLGAVELRAHAAASSDGLARIGVGMAIEDRRPRELLAHLEATRRTTSLLAVSRPPDDEALVDLLAALRSVTAQQRELGTDPARRIELGVEQRRLEQRIRNHVRRAPPSGSRAELALGASIARLGERVLVEYANVDGTLIAVTCVDNRAALHHLGPVDGLSDDIDGCSHALHRLNRDQGSVASRAAAVATLGAITADLSERLLPRRVRRSDRPLVVVPTGVLHALPWGALPGLTGRPVSVAPSLTGWAIAAARREPTVRVALVAGPALAHADGEVGALARHHRGAVVLTGADATAGRVVDAIGSSDLAHLACHGSYRSDNPLFSTLRMHDGTISAYDLERCVAMPRTVVLSACNVALGAAAGGGALLGLANSLMTFGAGTVIAPLTPVSDERVVAVMSRVHRGLLDGLDPSAALALAGVTEDGLLDPTAAAFVALGA